MLLKATERKCIVGLFAGMAASLLFAQTSNPPQFEYADVHTATAGADQGIFILTGRVEIHGATMLEILDEAYDIPAELIVGGPGWLNSDRFDIVAIAYPSTPEETLRVMLQALLADRFRLSAHRATQPMPAYALTLGKRSMKLKQSVGSAPAGCRNRREGALITRECHRTTMAEFAASIPSIAGNYVDQPVFDATGLAGAWDFKLQWTARGQLHNGSGDDVNIRFFDALEKQLGLKLELRSAPRSVLVVDAVARTPSPNAEPANGAPAWPTEFEVASIRPADPNAEARDDRVLPGGQVELSGSLKDLIAMAYRMEDYAVIGPKWIDSDLFNLVAKTEPGVPFDDMRGMLQRLLISRFQLETHREQRPVDVYALTARKSARGLREADANLRSICRKGSGDGVVTLTCHSTTMEQFVERMSDAAPGYVDRPVVDLTGLTGAYDFSLSWAPLRRMRARRANAGSTMASTPTGDLSFFEAVEKYLGLKVTAEKRPMPVLVVDRALRTPTEN